MINDLNEKGIKTLYQPKKTYEQLINTVPPESVLIFTAHGHDEKLDEIARRRGLTILDTTCPKVKNNLVLIKQELAAGHQVIYIGHKSHPETEAALSISSNVFHYDVAMGVDYSKITDPSPLVINQTTLNIIDIQKNFEDIKAHIPEARILEEICNTTRLRQEAVISLPHDVDLIIVVGDIYSSNTKRLYEIARMSHSETLSVMVSELHELDLNMLKEKKHVAIASGASTPLFAIEEIENYLKNLNN